MTSSRRPEPSYEGFEQGPIRPPSEASSLLIRVTRNCPWNRCTFCPVYKGSRFSLRPVAHVKKDIDAVHRYLTRFQEAADEQGRLSRQALETVMAGSRDDDPAAGHAALQWMGAGMRSIFLQDANSLIMRPEDLIEILTHLRDRLGQVERITSYARSHTIARISDTDLAAMAAAGLNRIHIGLESGSDKVLDRIKKGVDKATHIRAGVKVKTAGMELSEYVMPGLGGRELSFDHALETADALNRINPDFIRLRTLAIPNQVPLFDDHRQGRFEKCTDMMMAQEILLFLEMLDGITSTLKSDHILNLFQEVEGVLPEDKPKMIAVIRNFLDLPPQERVLYQIGRRLGIFQGLADMTRPEAADQVRRICRDNSITEQNVDVVIDEVMKRFI